MKKMYLNILVWFAFVSTSFAQSFVNLGSDSQNDVLCTCADLKTFSVAIDIAQDSVWFKIETYNARGAAYGYYIELDWDKNSSNGSNWTGGSGAGTCAGPLNYTDKRDRTINVWPTVKFFEQWSQSGGTSVSGGVVNVHYPDAYTTIINSRLSQVDSDVDGDFNVFASVGAQSFGYDMLDQMPNGGGFYNTASVVGVLEQILVTPQAYIKDEKIILKNIDMNNVSKILVYDLTGRLVFKTRSIQPEGTDINNAFIKKGIYIYRVLGTKEETIASGKMLKI